MISDEPDEDASDADDETVVESYLGPVLVEKALRTGQERGVTMWPFSGPAGTGLDIDPGTVAWFSARHADWRGAMKDVLRAWMRAHPGAVDRS